MSQRGVRLRLRRLVDRTGPLEPGRNPADDSDSATMAPELLTRLKARAYSHFKIALHEFFEWCHRTNALLGGLH